MRVEVTLSTLAKCQPEERKIFPLYGLIQILQRYFHFYFCKLIRFPQVNLLNFETRFSVTDKYLSLIDQLQVDIL